MEDASMVLVTLRYPSNPGALLVQGDALYHTGLFEHSLVSYYKVGRLAKKEARRQQDYLMFPPCSMFVALVKNQASRQPDILTKERAHLAHATPRAELAIKYDH